MTWIPTSKALPEKFGIYAVNDYKGNMDRCVFHPKTSTRYWKRHVKGWYTSSESEKKLPERYFYDNEFADVWDDMDKLQDKYEKIAFDAFLEGIRKGYDQATKEASELEKPIIKINLNERIKVKLTDLGNDIYYHRFDKFNATAGIHAIEPSFPRVDDDGYAVFQLWNFMEIYGPHIGMCKPAVIEPLEIIYEREE